MSSDISEARRRALEDAIEAIYSAQEGYAADGWQTWAVAAINGLLAKCDEDEHDWDDRWSGVECRRCGARDGL